MEANEQIFRHSLTKLISMSLVVLLVGSLALFIGKTDYFLMIITGIALIFVLFYATSSLKISDESITTSRFLISKSLRWTEIERISMKAQTLRLHNHDEDVVLSIDAQLNGYTKIVDIIFNKRPDLLDENEDTVMSSGWLATLIIVGFGLLIIAISVLLFSISREFEKIFAVILLGLGVYLIVSWLLSPKGVALEDKTLLLLYFFKEVSYPVEEIAFISLEKTSTKNGYVYFPQINLKSGKKIKLSGFEQGAIFTYQILKRWQKKATLSKEA